MSAKFKVGDKVNWVKKEGSKGQDYTGVVIFVEETGNIVTRWTAVKSGKVSYESHPEDRHVKA